MLISFESALKQMKVRLNQTDKTNLILNYSDKFREEKKPII